MSKGTTSYRIKDESTVYFLTFSTVEWIDIFTRQRYKDIVVDSLKYCQQEIGLLLYSWIIMSNHLHMIVQAKEGFRLSGIVRDFKKYTSKQIIKSIQEASESRRDWMLNIMKKSGCQNSKKQNYQLWRNDNHPVEVYSNHVIDQKVDYIHQNLVVAGIVINAEDYLYSSASSMKLLVLDEY